MTVNEVYQLIASLGFPIVISLYLLIYFRKTIDDLKKVIEQNTRVMAKLCTKLHLNEEGEKDD